MTRHIAVAAFCHTGGIAASLSAMLPDDEVVPCWSVGDADALRAEVEGATVWVTTGTDAENSAVADPLNNLEVLAIPNLLFTAFHPDLVNLPPGQVPAPLADYHSAIVLWGWSNGLDADAIQALFTPEIFDALGYHRRWHRAVTQLRSYFDGLGFDFNGFYLPLRRRHAWMLSTNHPRIETLVQLSRQIALRLGAEPTRVAYPWETVLPDALLATGPLWPVYPSVAEHLGFRGGFIWRRPDGAILSLERFIADSLDCYSTLDPASFQIDALADEAGFEFDALAYERWDPVLSHAVGAR